MDEPIEFAKLSGSGNDFICIDNRDGRFDPVLAAPDRVGRFARTLCRRGMGVGGDGVIFACRPEIEGAADVAARLFEADGSEAELCGNGTACFTRWVIDNGWVDHHEIKILTPAGVVLARNGRGSYVRVCIPLPQGMEFDLTLTVRDQPWRCDAVVIGVPHVLTYVDDVGAADVAHWGPALRHHEHFQPRGANADFVEVLETGRLALRTWEFGVEGETLACGTGSAAAAIMSAIRFDWPEAYFAGERAVEVLARSGDVLRVFFSAGADGNIDDVCVETIVRATYAGRLDPACQARAFGLTRPEPCSPSTRTATASGT